MPFIADPGPEPALEASPESALEAGLTIPGTVPGAPAAGQAVEVEVEVGPLSDEALLASCGLAPGAALPAPLVQYDGESPDELCLVQQAAGNGRQLLAIESGRTLVVGAAAGTAVVVERYERLATLGFTSARGRMSVLLRLPGGGLRLITKGADSALQPLLLAAESCDDARRAARAATVAVAMGGEVVCMRPCIFHW